MRVASVCSLCLALVLGLALMLGAGFSGPAAAQGRGPSFDCRKASTVVEFAICDSDEFAAGDLKLARLYRRAMRNLSPAGQADLKREQRAWLSDRNDCGSIPAHDYRFDQCLGNAIFRRIAELEELLDHLDAPANAPVQRNNPPPSGTPTGTPGG